MERNSSSSSEHGYNDSPNLCARSFDSYSLGPLCSVLPAYSTNTPEPDAFLTAAFPHLNNFMLQQGAYNGFGFLPGQFPGPFSGDLLFHRNQQHPPSYQGVSGHNSYVQEGDSKAGTDAEKRISQISSTDMEIIAHVRHNSLPAFVQSPTVYL
jgi:hypothetical protein